MKLKNDIVYKKYDDKIIIVDTSSNGNIFSLSGTAYILWDMLIEDDVVLEKAIENCCRLFPSVEASELANDVHSFVDKMENYGIIECATNVLFDEPYIGYKELFKILNEMNNINYAIIKGEALSYLAYNQVSQRKSNDIDILVSRDSLSSLKKILYRNGFATKNISREDEILILSGSHQITTWKKRISNNSYLKIDINFDVFWGEYSGTRMNINNFLDETIKIDLYGFSVKTLNPLNTMIQLILHHYKEMNSIYHLATHNSINVDMFKDIYYLWKNNIKSITLEALYDISVEYDIMPYVYYILFYVNQIYSDSELNKYVLKFQTDEGESLLNTYGLAKDEKKLWKVDFKTRLQTDDLYKLIQPDLTLYDREKLKRNIHIFME